MLRRVYCEEAYIL